MLRMHSTYRYAVATFALKYDLLIVPKHVGSNPAIKFIAESKIADSLCVYQ